MKKNITINLYGTLYAIDEDAYRMLERYLDSMKQYFMRQEGGAEIADDIEHRVAELFWKKKSEGMEAVDLATVKEIIEMIGNPEDIDRSAEEAFTEKKEAPHETASPSGEEASAQAVPEEGSSVWQRCCHRLQGRRFYRDPQNKIIAGVCAGLSDYMGPSDPLWWRLGFCLAGILFGSLPFHLPLLIKFFPFLLYFVLYLVAPVAHTPEDMLRMKGQEVSPETLKEQVISEHDPASVHRPEHRFIRGFLKVLAFMALGFVLLPLFGGLLFALLLVLVLILALLEAGPMIIQIFGDNSFTHALFQHNFWLWPLTVSGIVWGLISIYCILRLMFVRRRPLSSAAKVWLTIGWIFSLVTLLLSVFMMSVVNGNL